MKTLHPHRIEPGQILLWFIEATRLIRRRPLCFLAIEFIFFALFYLIIQATASIAPFTPIMVLLAFFFSASAIVLYFVVAELVIGAHEADHSRPVRPLTHLFALMGSQRALVKTAVIALFIGLFFWVVSLTVAMDKSVLSGSQRLLDSMLAEQAAPWLLECKLAAGFLYFLVLAMFSLRVFFSIPLMLFHDLDGDAAQALSHRAIVINIQPMSLVLLVWAMLLLGSMLFIPLLSLALLPLLGAFIYVGYRHVFLGEPSNAPARAVKTTAMETGTAA